MRKPTVAALAAITIACGARAPISPTTPSANTQPASYAQPPKFMLSGLVFENRGGVKQPVGGASVAVWGVPCRTTSPNLNGCTTWLANIGVPDLVSDSEGRFVAPVPGGSLLTVLPYKRGFVQPCGASVLLQQDLGIEVELMSADSFNTMNPPLPSSSGPLLTGTVFETTPDGPVGVAGAYVSVESLPDLVVADTITDLAGRFAFCNGTSGAVYAGKGGYRSSGAVSSVSGMTIELKRN
jgi:hypothetical protein